MTLEDILTFVLLAALFLFSVALTRLINKKGKSAQPLPNTSTGESAANDKQAAESAQDIKVTFSRSGKQYPWDPTQGTLLDFAESQGIDIDFQCRAGECGSCETRLISGDVEYRQPPQVQLTQGYCLMCISIPRSDITLES
jgi:uncharacterized protein